MSNTTSNTFKVGDKIVLTPRNELLPKLLTEIVHRHSGQTEFTLSSVGLATHNALEEHLKQPSAEPDCVAFKCDECGKEYEFHYLDISLASVKPLTKGDKVTVNSTGLTATQTTCLRDTTQGKEYLIIATGDEVGEESAACRFIDDHGDEVTLNSSALTLVS